MIILAFSTSIAVPSLIFSTEIVTQQPQGIAINVETETLKKLLLTVKNISPQRLADIILQETIDSNFGIAKDDMTVIVAKVV